MKDYLIHHSNLLRILTGISFLLIYIPGDTIAAFVIMALILYPILIADGSSNMCNLNINPALTIFIDLVLVMMLYASVIYLIRSGVKKVNSKRSDNLCIISVLILYIYVAKIFMSQDQTTFSLITIGVFIFFSLFLVFASSMEKEASTSS